MENNQQSPNPIGSPTGQVPPDVPPTTPPNPEQPHVTEPNHPDQPKKKKSFKLLLIILVLLIAAGAGYWWYSGNKTTKTSSLPQAKAVDVDKITYALVEGPVNPIYPDSGLVAIPIQTNMQLFEGLVAYKDQTKIVPLLAESWTNPDEKTWVFKIRQDVKFHNGNTLKAKHVKNSIEEVKNDSANETFASVFLSSIDKITVVDDSTVKITTTYPDPVLLNKLVNAFIYDTDAKTRKDAANGSGPYVIKAGTKTTENSIVLTAFNDYRDPVHTKEVEYIVYKKDDNGKTDQDSIDAQLIKDLTSGKVDMAAVTGSEYINKATANPMLKLVKSDSGIGHLLYNTTKKDSPYGNKKIRQAIVEAVDIEAVLKNTKNENIRVPADQIVTQSIPGYNPAIKRPAYNLEHAKTLVKEAGYVNGITVSCVFATPSKNFADDLQRQLKLANINLKIVIEDNDDTFFEKLFTDAYDCVYLSYSPDTLDGLEAFTTEFQSDWYKNPELDAMVEKIKNTFNSTERLKLMQETSKLLADDYPWFPMSTRVFVWGIQKDLNVKIDRPGGEYFVYFKDVTRQVPVQ